MKKIALLVCLVCLSNEFIGQNYDFGKVSKAELEEAYYPLDSSANAAILYKKRRSYYDMNHEGIIIVSEIHFRIKIYNKEGFDWATEEIELYNSNSSKETVSGLKATTYNLENGKVVATKLNKKDIYKEEKNKFIKVQKFTMPNLKEGCVIEWKYVVRSPNYGSIDDVVLQYSIPLKKYEGRIELLEYFHFNKRTKGYFSIPILEKTRRNHTLDTSDKVYTINMDNVPALKNESYVDNINNYRAGVVFEVASISIPGYSYKTFANNWDAVTKTVYKSSNFGGELDKKAYLKEDIAQLKTQFVTPSEKIIGGLEFVKSKVKWNEYYGKYVHNGVKNAYKKGVGNSGEINLMLVTVLRELGLNANPIILSTRKNGIPILPTTDGLNYVIAAVELNENVILLDATEPFSTPNVLPLRALNWQGRLIRETGSSTWVKLGSDKIATTSSTMSINIDDEGGIEGMSRTQYTNLFALNYRNKFSDLTDDDIIEKIEEKNEAIEISDFRISNKNKIYKAVVEMYKFSSEDLIEIVGDKIYFQPLLFNATTENPFKLEIREYPIDFGTPLMNKNNVGITIPEGYTVESVPESFAIGLPDDLGVYKFHVSVSGNKINVISTLQINSAIYPAQDYAQIKEFYRLIVNKNTEKVVLKRS